MVYLRIFLTIFLFWLFYQKIPSLIYWTIIIYIFSKFLDNLDGGLARLKGQATVIGEIIDPLADRLLNLLVLGILIYLWHLQSLWIYLGVSLISIFILSFNLLLVLIKPQKTLFFNYFRKVFECLGFIVTIIFLLIEIF